MNNESRQVRKTSHSPSLGFPKDMRRMRKPGNNACNLFPILIKSSLIINNESGTAKTPHEHFTRGCTNFKSSQTIMNWGGFEVIRGGIIENPKELGIPLTSEVLVDFHIGFIKDYI